MSIPYEEQETVIIFNGAKKIWEAGTNIPAHQRIFESRGWKKVGETSFGDIAYEAPKNALSFRNLTARKTRTMTEEQREAAARRLAEARERRALKKAS